MHGKRKVVIAGPLGHCVRDERSLQDCGACGNSEGFYSGSAFTQQEARKICLGRILPRFLLRLCVKKHAGSAAAKPPFPCLPCFQWTLKNNNKKAATSREVTAWGLLLEQFL